MLLILHFKRPQGPERSSIQAASHKGLRLIARNARSREASIFHCLEAVDHPRRR